MTTSNFNEYINSLQEQIAELTKKLESVEKEIFEQGIASSLRQNDIPGEVSSSLSRFKPEGLTNISVPESLQISLDKNTILESLTNLYKL